MFMLITSTKTKLIKKSSYLDLLERTIPQFITTEYNEYLTKMSWPKEIKNIIYNMDSNYTPSPDGIGGYFSKPIRILWGENMINLVS